MRKKICFPSYLLENQLNVYMDPIYSALKHKIQIKAKPFPNTQKTINSKFKFIQKKLESKKANNTSIVPRNNSYSMDLIQKYIKPVQSHFLNPNFITSLIMNPIQHGQSNFQIVPYVPPPFYLPKNMSIFSDYQIKTQKIKKLISVKKSKQISLRPFIPYDDDNEDYSDDYLRLKQFHRYDKRIARKNYKKEMELLEKARNPFTKLTDLTEDDINAPEYIY